MKIKKTFRLIFLNECFLFILNTWQQWLRILVRRESLWSISLYLVNGVEYSASHGILFSISGTSLDELKLWARQCNIKSNWHLKVYFFTQENGYDVVWIPRATVCGILHWNIQTMFAYVLFATWSFQSFELRAI